METNIKLYQWITYNTVSIINVYTYWEYPSIYEGYIDKEETVIHCTYLQTG